MNYVRLIAPAKVNLVLAVGEKREDGFHEVNTIMHSLAFHDTLIMRRFEAENDEIQEGAGANGTAEDGVAEGSANTQDLTLRLFTESAGDINALEVAPENNLVYKAVMNLARVLDRGHGEEIHIKLQKQIPHEAGLGGGSSDAAAALVGAALLWDVPTDDEHIFEVAAELGSDVSFFLHGGCVLLEGKGEQFVRRLEPRRDFVLLVRPDAGVSTAAAYKEFDRNPLVPEASYLEELKSIDAASDVKPWNNLAPAAAAVTPELVEVQQWAESHDDIDGVLLCGSGSAFCLFCRSHDQAQKLAAEAFSHGWWTRITSFSRVGAAAVEAY